MLPFKLLFHPGFAVDRGPHVFPADGADFLAPPPAADANDEAGSGRA